mmetsp:Transcript_46591/g.77018  ORF Transcript_46591/g.77018 Transcript_46591/m.77018 type:complete len:96 (-) Transcript_46591:208-495(-)|eukprot:CAMPEP_0119304400 /NCGR_PEP_ID=MMETSP1333-20130426/5634_1 /TAXON_ID=418940 /ORGANISM="Scyphosphaera apsteinii, Strain RCC1455" /LENGTH=95 /DNA_ID=CAMNT_0007307279 /DNA_START=144 /DNA_END=431 /DNA_ORIENTATION=-
MPTGFWPAGECAFSHETLGLLQRLLHEPFVENLGVGHALPVGGLRDTHIFQLVQLAGEVQQHFQVHTGGEMFDVTLDNGEQLQNAPSFAVLAAIV